jgi:hypothetical protein
MNGREAIFARIYCQINTNTTFAAMIRNGRQQSCSAIWNCESDNQSTKDIPELM